MSNIYMSVEQLMGKTPLLKLCRLQETEGLSAEICAKLEGCNPAGSAKDRVALSMIKEAEADGRLQSGATVIEPTSGNTGIGLCAVAAARGYRAIIVMPDTMSEERRRLVKAYGGELVLTDGALGMQGAIAKAKALASEIPNAWVAGQFDNPANALAHYRTTGPEIWEDTDGEVDVFVAGIGTGGTITGVGRYLREKNPNVRIVGVEPAGSPYLTEGRAGAHGLQGIGAGFLPSVLDTEVYHEVITVTEQEAYAAARLLGRCEGVLVGISSGAALHAAMTLARQSAYSGKRIVVLLPDGGERYLTTPLFGA